MEVRLLGPLEVDGHGGPVALPRGRARSLLALLALHAGEVLATDRLVDELWGGDPPRTAVTALHGLVSTVRRRLEPDRDADDRPTVLVTHAPGYVLALDRDGVDAHRFDRLVDRAAGAPVTERADRLHTALDLWRGPALVDFSYEPFAQTPIAALEERRITAIEARIDADLALGRHGEVVAELEELVTAQPHREQLRAHLMTALYRCGRQAEALAAYRDVRARLIEELGVEPGRELQALEQAILTQDRSLDVPRPTPARAADVGTASTDRSGPWLDRGRRTVTVALVDLSASESAVRAGAAVAVDPEAALLASTEAQTAALRVVEGHGGTVEGTIGDVLVAVFGRPVAHEDDARRAVHAAARLQGDLAALGDRIAHDHGVRLAARIGIETGEVVVRDPAAATSGPPVARATRLQRDAEPGEVWLGDATRRIVEDIAVVEPVPPPGGAVTSAAWRLVELAPAPTGLAVADTTPLVGRDGEVAELAAALDRAVRRGRAGLVTVLGEAGVGKSRLAQAFAEESRDRARVVTGRCRTYGEGITFWPLREIVQGLGMGRAGLDSLLERPADLFHGVRELLEAAADDQPLVVLVEDVHWAQPTFLDLVAWLGASLRAPVLLVCLGRPELVEIRPGWATEVAGTTTIELDPLGHPASRQLVINRLGGRGIPPEALGRVLAMGQGNPLFLEQLLAAQQDRHDVGVPASVQALVTARLDRLGPAERDLLRCASVIGVDGSLDAVRALVPAAVMAHVDRHLRSLEDKQLLRPAATTTTDTDRFAFRHVMVQQAAYGTMTHAARADLHERVATWLENGSEGPVGRVEELLGLHLEQAVRHRQDLRWSDASTDELAVRAGERLASAGLRAYARFDVPAAENLLSRARALLPPDHADRPAVLRRLTEAYPVMGLPDDATACFDELLALVDRDGDEVQSRGVRLEQIRFQLITGPDPIPMATIQQQIEDSLAVFRAAGDEVRVSQAHYALGSVHLRAGRMPELADVAWRGIDRARRTNDLRERLGAPWWVLFHLLEGPTPVPSCIRACEEIMDVGGLDHLGVLAALGRFRAMQDEFDEGRHLADRARELLRERIRLPRPLAFIGQQRAALELLAGDLDAAGDALQEALDVALRITERDHAAQIAARLSLVRSRQGAVDDAARLATLAAEQAPAEGLLSRALANAAEARVLADRGEVATGERRVRAAIARVPADMLTVHATLNEVVAEVLDRGGRGAAAGSAVDRAVALHDRKGSPAGARWARDVLSTRAR